MISLSIDTSCTVPSARLRLITYIRTVMNHSQWNTLIPTPNHPEYPSGRSILPASARPNADGAFWKRLPVYG